MKELAHKGIARSEVVLATKGGFIPFDSAPPRAVRAHIEETFVSPGVVGPGDIVSGCHCMSARYLMHQLECSLRNLAVECVDIYYVHNPETQLGEESREEFGRRIHAAFEAIEGAVLAGKIRMYGTATWNGYRNDPAAKDYLSLADLVAIARWAGGKEHHFKLIQLPVNLGMAEALTKKNQPVEGEMLTALEAAQRLGISVMSSASILQGQLTRNLPNVVPGLATDGQRAIQFVRSTPGVTTALVGMKQRAHVKENMAVAGTPPVPWVQFAKLFNNP